MEKSLYIHLSTESQDIAENGSRKYYYKYLNKEWSIWNKVNLLPGLIKLFFKMTCSKMYMNELFGSRL